MIERMKWTFVALTLAGTAMAADLTVADLHGTYGIKGGRDWSVEVGEPIHPFPTDHLGTLTLDGAGNVVGGVRTFRVPPLERATQSSTFFTQVAIGGTYTVSPDGTGSITVTWDRPIPQLLNYPASYDLFETLADPTDRMDFALQGSGFVFWSVIRSHVHWRSDVYSPWHDDPPRDHVTAGEAQLVESPCRGLPRRIGGR